MRISDVLLDDIKNDRYTSARLGLLPSEKTHSTVLADEDVIKLADALSTNTHITSLDLRFNNIGNKGVGALSKIKTLEELDLTNGLAGYEDHANHVTVEGALALADSHLKKLKIRGNPIGDEGLQALSASTSIQELDASSCNITGIGVTAFFNSNKTVIRLDLSENGINNVDLSAIAYNYALEHLTLNHCELGSAAVKWLGSNNSLLTLSLDQNPIGDEGTIALSQHPRLKTLSLVNCGITDVGFLAFNKNTHLVRLILSSNCITAAGIQALSSLSALSELHLSNNRIQFDKACIKALIAIPSLTVLKAENNRVSSTAAKAMSSLCENTAIQEFDLSLYRSNNIPKTFLIRYPSKRKLEDVNTDSQDVKRLATAVAKHSL